VVGLSLFSASRSRIFEMVERLDNSSQVNVLTRNIKIIYATLQYVVNFFFLQQSGKGSHSRCGL